MHGLWRRLVELLRSARLDKEAVEELSRHVELLVAEKMEGGLDEEEARRQALVEVGSVSSACEQIAEERTRFPLDQLATQLRYAARVLRRSPGVTSLSVVTMGVGIGLSAIVFTLVNRVVLRPLPYPEADRLVRIFDVNPQAGVARAGVATGNLDDWRQRAGIFDGIAGYYVMGRTVSFDQDAEVFITAQVSQDFLKTARVEPLVGHAFTEEETQRALFDSAEAPTGPDPVVMLSHGVWLQKFGGDPNVVGRTIVLERRPFRVVGVMPSGFALPDVKVQLWIPWNVSQDRARDQHYLGAIARLKTGVSLEQAESTLNVVASDLSVEYPDTNRGWGVSISPLAVETVGSTANVLWILLASVGLLLLVVCANVALLSLMRGFDRREETYVRLALGASRARLLQEFLLESALLALIGGLLGVAVTFVGLRLLPFLVADLPRLSEVAFDFRVFGFVVAITTLAGMLSGLPQAWARTRVSRLAVLSASSFRASESPARHRLRDSIVVIQVAIAVVLMTGSGLLVRSFLYLRATDPGFDPSGVLVMPIFLDTKSYTSGEEIRTYYRTLFERLSALPGVIAVGGATSVPTSPLGPDFERPVWPQDSEADSAQRTPASMRMVTPGYFKAMGIRIVDGRPIDDRDTARTPRVLMVSETLAKRLWPGQSPVGKQLVVDYSTAGNHASEIIGVVGDLRFRGPRSEPLSEIYLPHAQRSYLILNVVVKTMGDPRALVPDVRSALNAVDVQRPPQGMYPLEDLIGATYERDRQAMVTLGVFAITAIFLALLSIYSVLSQRVRERSREIAIRMAVGANASHVIRWVLWSGLRLIGLGLLIGMIVARLSSSALAGLLFGVAVTDLLTMVSVTAVLALIGVITTLAPSWRATRIDPVKILKRG